MGLLIVVAMVLAVNSVVFGEDKEVTVGDITAKVLGHSGKIKIYKSNESDPNMVTITMDYIKELTSDEQAITGSNARSYNSFASLDFTFSDLTNDTFPDSNVSVTQFSFTANIDIVDGTATELVTYFYMFTEDGNITVNGEEYELKAGDVKFNVKITDWPFCGQGFTCQQGQTPIVGAFLDFAIEMKGSGTTTAVSGDSDLYELGGGARVLVPKKVSYDGADAVDMPAGYPAHDDSVASKPVFIFRFVPFTTSALYDPIVSTGSTGGNPDEDTEAEVTSGDISAKALGKSGKIRITSTATGDSGDNEITVEFDYLKELTADDDVINDNDHKFNGFANQLFTFSAVVDEQYQSLNVQRLTFTSTLNNGATLTVTLYVFKQGGSLTNGDETLDVVTGSVKFTVEIENWSFCQACQQSGQSVDGAYLDFAILIKGKSATADKKTKDAKKGVEYDLGGGSVLLSEKVKVDGTFQAMTTGYPKKESQGGKEVFLFRFTPFATGVLYDPIMTLTAMTHGNGSTQLRMSIGAMLLLVIFHVMKWY